MPSSLAVLDPAARRFTVGCTLLVLICYCSSAYMQEKIFLVPGFTFGFYLTFVEFIVNAGLALVVQQINLYWTKSPLNFAESSMKEERNKSSPRRRNGVHNAVIEVAEESVDNRSSWTTYYTRGYGKEPYYHYFLLAISAVVSMGCSNTSLTFVSYPTKIVVKASKVVLIMVS